MEKTVKHQVLLLTTFLLAIVLNARLTGCISAQELTTLHQFTLAPNDNNSDGRNPHAGPTLAGTMLFGAAYDAGQHASGEIFGLNTDGTGFMPYYSFSQANGTFILTNREGCQVQSALLFTGAALIGAASNGGTNGTGTIFELSLATGLKVLHTFETNTTVLIYLGTNRDGSSPVGGMALAGTLVYGTAEYGGSKGNGTVFVLDDTSLGFTNLHNFTALQTNRIQSYTNSDGANPQGRLVLSGNMLYGTAVHGGVNGYGTIFAVNTTGTIFTTLHSFSAYSNDVALGFDGIETNYDGANPVAGLVISNNILYGVTTTGGSGGSGTVFAVNTEGLFSTLHSFAPHGDGPPGFGGITNMDGVAPSGDLALSGNILYGTTSSGGTNGEGTIFCIGIDGSGFTVLHTFSPVVTNSPLLNPLYTNYDGAVPMGGLVVSSNMLYGTTTYGGLTSDGTVFSLSLLPQMGIVRAGTNVVMTWSTNLPGYTVEFTTNLAPAFWVTNPTAPVIRNGQYELTNSTPGKQRFFRLKQ